MNSRWIAVSLVVLATSAGAQAPAATTRSAQCQTASNNYINQKAIALRDAGTRLTADVIRPLQVEAKRMARECAASIPIEGASIAELTGLASLYLYVNDTAKAIAASKAAIDRPNLTESERADASLGALRLSIATFDPFLGINRVAETIVSNVDAMSDAVLPQKISAHESLMGRYDYADVDEGLLDHARKLLVLSQRALQTKALGMSQPRAGVPAFDLAYAAMANAYGEIARAAGDYLHADSALAILAEEERVLGANDPGAHDELEAQRAMYKLVGTDATPIDGKWWINGPDGASVKPGEGKVTLIQFTAHWCVPCKKSYPGFLRLSSRFDGKPFEPLLVTDLYGYIGSQMNLAPEQEVAADREYYVTEHHLPFKIAINPPLARGDTVTRDNDRRYVVNGIPEIIVVDKRGTIRATVVGWDSGNERRLGDLIDTLLREKRFVR
jgi:thiol-disulfide isomerase/thioredoxin